MMAGVELKAGQFICEYAGEVMIIVNSGMCMKKIITLILIDNR